MVGPISFTLGWLVLGWLSPGFYTVGGLRLAPYSAVSQQISRLGVGPTAPFMNSMFEVSGTLTLIGVVGIVGGQPRGARHLRMLLVLLALPALGSMMDGVFTLRYEFMHSLGFVLALASMVALPAAGRLLRQNPPWKEFGNWLFVAGPLTLFLALWFLASVTPSITQGTAGLAERILVMEIASWYVALGCWAFARRAPRGTGTHPLGAATASRRCRSAEGVGSGSPGPHGVLGPHKF